ncbi:MAG: MaoC family dehydratase [Steroidobacteraceae bacterium]
MGAGLRLDFANTPGIWGSYSRVVASRKPATLRAGATSPRIEATLAATRADPGHLARYAAICEVPRADRIPIAYPHMLASGMHLAMLSSSAFPISVLGLVHVGNRIVRGRAIDAEECLALRSWIEGHRDTDRGQEFDLETEGRIGGAVVWRETCTFLARRHGKPAARPSTDKARQLDGGGPVRSSSFAAPSGLGRRYASVSGDYNPIHLADLAARPFGFRKAIAHGMWSLARCAAELGEIDASGRTSLDVTFRLPVYLPAWVILESCDADGGIAFTLRDSTANRPYLTGDLRTAGA